MNAVFSRQKSLTLAAAVVAVTSSLATANYALADQQLIYSVRSHSERNVKTDKERHELKSTSEDTPLVEDKQYTEIITLGDAYVIREIDGQKTIIDFAKKFMYRPKKP